jgi:hypothetical protein
MPLQHVASVGRSTSGVLRAYSLGPRAFVFVDPFNLRSDREASTFTVASVSTGAVVMAWYPLYGPTGHPHIDTLWDSLPAPTQNRSMRG